jgi:hypothetical protein
MIIYYQQEMSVNQQEQVYAIATAYATAIDAMDITNHVESTTMDTAGVNGGNAMKTDDVVSKSWQQLVKEWTPIALTYMEATDNLAQIMNENFRTPTAFRNNVKAIKRAILDGLSKRDQHVMLASDPSFKGKTVNVYDLVVNQNTLKQERVKVQSRVIYISSLLYFIILILYMYL